MTYIYHAKENEVREKAPQKPDIRDDFYLSLMQDYKQRIASMKRYPCTEACKELWKDGQEVEEWVDFLIVNKVMGKGGIADLVADKDEGLKEDLQEVIINHLDNVTTDSGKHLISERLQYEISYYIIQDILRKYKVHPFSSTPPPSTDATEDEAWKEVIRIVLNYKTTYHRGLEEFLSQRYTITRK